MTAERPVFVMPGWKNSEPDHWQSIWERTYGYTRLNQNEWERPRRQDWLDRAQEVISAAPQPPLIVAHSMGCLLAVILAAETRCAVHGVFLVAPVDLGLESTPDALANFRPTPMQKLRCPSVVIGSRNDPYCRLETARKMAGQWGSDFIDLGAAGHINLASGLGGWETGHQLFEQFQTRCSQ